MTTSEIHRKCRILWLSFQIANLRLAMSLETGVTDQWKFMAWRQAKLIRDRQAMMTPAEIRDLERRRGLL